MKRNVMAIMRLLVTVIVVGTLACMVFSLREQNAKLSQQVKLLKGGEKGEGEVYVLCRFDLKPDADRADYIKKTLDVVPTVRAEAGCLGYTLLEDAKTDWDKPQRFGERTLWMLEKWASIDALKAHLETPHMKAFGPTVRPMRTNGTFHVLQEL